MSKLDEFKGLIVVDSEIGTAAVYVGEDALADLLDVASELSGDTKVFGIHVTERDLFGDSDVTELIAQAAADEYVTDNAWQIDDPDWSENAGAFISAHAQDYLDIEIQTARSGAIGQQSEVRSLRATYQTNVL